MAITRQAATNWTRQGATDRSSTTYASVQRALEQSGIVRSRDLEIFLQGSYANSTNVPGDSDVDIVVMTKLAHGADISKLSTTSQARWRALPDATYTATDLRQEVAAALIAYYGDTRVHLKNKCIRVDAGTNTLDADVVPCTEYRNYVTADPSSLSSGYIEGVRIKPRTGAQIINYPKEHIENGKAKNRQAAGDYKETVRQVKQLRSHAVDQGLLPDGISPGYLLECMVYNVPDGKFAASDDWQRLADVLIWLRSAALEAFWSCDGVHLLFKTDPGQFSAIVGRRIIDALWEAL